MAELKAEILSNHSIHNIIPFEFSFSLSFTQKFKPIHQSCISFETVHLFGQFPKTVKADFSTEITDET